MSFEINVFFLFQKLKFILLYYIKTKNMANIFETIQKNDILKVLLVLLGVYLLITYVKPMIMKEKYESVSEHLENVEAEKPVITMTLAQPEPAELEGSQAPVLSEEQKHIDKIVAGETQLKAEDLLPKYDDANAFAKENPVSDLLKEQNFLISGYHVGINTVLQSNKIPYLDIRSLPPIPKESVGPWNQSSYEQSPSQLRRGVEIL